MSSQRNNLQSLLAAFSLLAAHGRLYSMVIYGTGLLAACLLIGLMLGQLLGWALGLEANVGGVGVAMLLLIVVAGRLQAKGMLPRPTQSGILFWSGLYIPIVVAMAASQNVRAALSGGTVALVAGAGSVAVSFALVPVISRLGPPSTDGNEAVDASTQERPR